MKKRILCTALSLCLCLGLSAPALAAGPTFTDVPANHWAYDYVERAAENGWVNGIGNGQFAPEKKITYAEMSVMLMRAFYPDTLSYWGGSPNAPWYEPYMAEMAVTGLDNGTLVDLSYKAAANELINRYEMAQLIYNFMKQDGDVTFNYNAASVQSGISDWASVPSNYRDAVTAVVAKGVVTGVDSQGTFNGNGVMTRAQAATVMCRAVDLMGEGVSTINPTPTPTQPSGSTGSGLGQKLPSGATAAAGVKSSIGKSDAYPTYGNSDVVSNNGYFTGATNTDIGNAHLEYEFLDWVNEVRVAEGHAPLTWVPSDAAEEHGLQRCYELVSNFSHDRPKGKLAAEVCASGYITSTAAFDGWMNSSAHKHLLMSDSYQYMSAARAGNYWIICLWRDSSIKQAEKWAYTNYDSSSENG
ncbi:S-layer homology domain-containing protein [Intestinimonas sp. HCP28S3_D6]|uniref:CAP and S-layer homology domain-containing protein n=1 Tax=Intestinimonas sp. HCP28S3_D6 TaxID=3438942 RepID=UPI003F8A98B5